MSYPSKKRIVVLISGRGSNLIALHAAAQAQAWPAEIVAVISNRADAAGLTWAQQNGLATAALSHRDFAGREAFDQQLQTLIDGYQPDLVVLAGFMRILSAGFVAHYQGKLLNIHPSLLPAFPGLHTHEQALAAGVRIHGATVHFVTPALDHGPIVVQGAVPVLAGDTPASLGERVLTVEHQIYAQAVAWFVTDRLTVVDGLVHVDGAPPRCRLAESSCWVAGSC